MYEPVTRVTVTVQKEGIHMENLSKKYFFW